MALPRAAGSARAPSTRESGLNKVLNTTMLHLINLPQVLSTHELVYDKGYNMGYTELDGKKSHYVIPEHYKKLQVTKTSLLTATRSVFPDVDKYDTDLGGWVNPLAEQFLTPHNGVSWDMNGSRINWSCNVRCMPVPSSPVSC